MRHNCWFAKSLVVYKDIFYVSYDYGMMLKILWVIIPSHWKDCIYISGEDRECYLAVKSK